MANRHGGGYYDPHYYDRGYGFNSDTSPYDYYDYWETPSSRGRYSGYGPIGYTRPDDRIQDDVNDLLTWHSQIDATDVHVEVHNGVVTLTGVVASRRDKRLAEDIAESVRGVWDVNNQLSIRNPRWTRGEPHPVDRNQIRPGMDVLGSDGERVGKVKDVRSDDFLLDRFGARDPYVPLTACHTADEQVRLDVPSTDVDNQGWLMAETAERHRSR